MLNIELDGRHLTVTRGAYNSVYAPNGWKIVGEEKAEKKKETKNTENKATEKVAEEKNDDPWAEVEDEIEDEAVDIDSMSAKALKRLAKEKGLNPDDYKTLGELKKALKSLV